MPEREALGQLWIGQLLGLQVEQLEHDVAACGVGPVGDQRGRGAIG